MAAKQKKKKAIRSFVHVGMEKPQMKTIDRAVKKSAFSCKSEWIRITLIEAAKREIDGTN